MQPTAAQFCQAFKNQFGEIKRRFGQIPPNLIDMYMRDPLAVDEKLITELSEITELRNAFMQAFLPRAKYMVEMWAHDNLDTSQMSEIEKIEFDDDGRAAVTGEIKTKHIMYFPNLIKKVVGNMRVPTIDIDVPIDNLEEVEGNLDITSSAVTSMRRLRRVTNFFTASNAQISDLGMLEETEALMVASCKNLSNMQSLRGVKYGLYAMGTNISAFPSLESVGREFAVSGPFVSAPKLQEVGAFGGEDYGEIRIGDSQVTNFRESFPILRKVGINGREPFSFYLSEDQEDLANQILDLKEDGQLEFSGQIKLGNQQYVYGVQ